MNRLIRDALVSDAPILLNTEKEIAINPGYLVSRPSELVLESFQKKIEVLSSISNGKYIVAEQDGQLVGHALLEPMGLESIQHIVRLTIAVHPGFEEKGIGTILMNHLIEWAKKTTSVEKIELNVRATNTRAIALYQKLGFYIEGRIKNRVKFPSGEYADDILMGLFV